MGKLEINRILELSGWLMKNDKTTTKARGCWWHKNVRDQLQPTPPHQVPVFATTTNIAPANIPG